MSLDNMLLTEQSCAILYPRSLIKNSEKKTDSNTEPDFSISSLGQNQSHILFIVNNADYKFLSDDEMEVLGKLLTACNLSMADIALVNYHFNKQNYQEFNRQFIPKKVLIFGIKPTELELPFDIPHFQVQPFQTQLYLTAPDFETFLKNTDLKRQLWASLQKLFL
ncbi:MAG TPA: hypothetical protein VFF23_13905 [Hanamia sp.]|nr:hypothetical protein [Hanamia sp.]